MKKQSINKSWRFYLEGPAEPKRQEPDISTWRLLDLPHDWSIELERSASNPSAASNGFFQMGRGWYQKSIDAPEEWRGKKVLVEFEGVYMNAEVWLNDNFIGRHPYGYTSFIYDLTPYLKFGETNVVKVSVDNSGQLNSRWYSGSGIYRPVWLIVTEPVHIAHWGVYVTTSAITAESASVRAQTTVQNENSTSQQVTLRSKVLAPNGEVAAAGEGQITLQPGETYEFVQDLKVSAPKLWAPETPSLYRLESQLLAGETLLDVESTPFGIRSISVSAETGFLLNGKPLLMKGGCVHHDNGVLGATSFSRSEERKVELLKASGYNAVRCAHNPPAPAFLDACDRLGMVVIDETFDCWRTGKNPFDYHVVFEDWWQRDTDSMVLRDRNHPSVVVWSIGNEVYERDGRSNGAAIARMQAEHVRKLDPTRPVTSAICGVWDKNKTWVDTDVIFAALDIGGYNYQWKQYQPDHERHPQRVMFGTESIPGEALENWVCVEENSYVIGDFVWTSLDYLGESGIGRQHFETEKKDFLGEYPWHQAYCGDIDLAGFKRPQSYYRDIVWGNGNPLYIAVHYPIPEGKTPVITYWGWPDVDANWNWPGREGETFKVDVYSASEKVELFLNGRSLGVKPAGRAEKLTAAFEVPYEPGELKAVGYQSDQPVAEYAIHTVGAPAGIRLSPDRAEIRAGADDLSYITVEVVDEQGCLDPNAGHNIFFTVKGEGEILAVGSGNPTSTELYRGNQRKAFRGRCLVVVKSTGKAGEIHLRAQADGLDGAAVVIRAV